MKRFSKTVIFFTCVHCFVIIIFIYSGKRNLDFWKTASLCGYGVVTLAFIVVARAVLPLKMALAAAALNAFGQAMFVRALALFAFPGLAKDYDSILEHLLNTGSQIAILGSGQGALLLLLDAGMNAWAGRHGESPPS